MSLVDDDSCRIVAEQARAARRRYARRMEIDPTDTSTSGDPAADDGAPIPLDLPKGLVTENAFRWPADPMARGGMAQIFAGEDRRLGRSVILKAPREGDDLPAGVGDMFQRRVTAEARILAKLQHP